MGKDWKVRKQAKLAVVSHSAPFQWEPIGKAAKWVKLAILSHSAPHQWAKIKNVAKQTKKFAVLSHSVPLL